MKYTSASASWGDGGESSQYRYSLARQWRDPVGLLVRRCLFIMLNPSKAGGGIVDSDDPTIRRCSGFASSWFFDAMAVVNIFGFRATDPAEMRAAADPIGIHNDQTIETWARNASMVVAAWGTHGSFLGRDKEVIRLLEPLCDLHVLGLTKDGHPAHPLYLRGDLKPVLWKPRKRAA